MEVTIGVRTIFEFGIKACSLIGDQEPQTDRQVWHHPLGNYADSNLAPRVSHHHNPGGGKMRDPENEAALREVRGIQASGRDVSLIKLEKRGNAMC